MITRIRLFINDRRAKTVPAQDVTERLIASTSVMLTVANPTITLKAR